MKKDPLLFLCQRIPYPPNKGDKITTFNLLKFLSQQYDVHLGCFVDDPFDRQYIQQLDQYCQSCFSLDICNRGQLTSGIKALFSETPVSVEYYRSDDFQRWVDQTISDNDIDRLLVYSSVMTQFIAHSRYQKKTRILDMADIDSDKWRQYAQKKPWFSKWVYFREQRLLAQLEQKALAQFEALTLISDLESRLFRQMSPTALAHKIHTLSNGVDTKYFSPDAIFDLSENPQLSTPSICFTGAMDYWANVDAMVWFCDKVWPRILQQQPQTSFYIVGGNPPQTVKQLNKIKGVTVTGRVADVRPYLAGSQVAVAPMQIARGIQNKVLEAMAMAKPVVMTSKGNEGIALDDNQQLLVHDDPNKMASCIIDLLQHSQLNFQRNRQWIIDRYGWHGALAKLPELLNIKKEFN